MGKKIFVDDAYDPLGAQMQRDAERQARQAQPSSRREETSDKSASVVPLRPRNDPVLQPHASVPQQQDRAVEEEPSERDLEEVSPRIKVTRGAMRDFQGVLDAIQRSTGSKVAYGIATRALWGVLVHAEAQVLEEVRKRPLGKLPSTNDKLAYAAYEQRVTQAFASALRRLPRSIFRTPSESLAVSEDEAEA